MTQAIQTNTGQPLPLPEGIEGIVADWSSGPAGVQECPLGKAMMWIFLLSDTFIFSSFLISYMTVRMSTTEPWPTRARFSALTLFGHKIPLILIAIMTFVLIKQQRDDGHGVKLRLSKRSCQNLRPAAGHRGIGGHIRRDAGLRVDQAGSWMRAYVPGATPWERPSSARPFS